MTKNTAAAVVDTIEPEKSIKKTPACPRGNIKLRESCNNVHRLIAPRGTTRERLLDSDFHAIVADLYVPYDEVLAVAEDRSYYARLLILECGRGWASAIELEYHTLPPLLVVTEKLPPGFDIRYDGPESLFTVHRLCDGIVMATGFSDSESARAWLVEHASLR